MDGVSLCRLRDEDVHGLRLTVGVQLGPEELEAVRAAAGRAEAMSVGLRYLSVRPRSRREVERRLGRDRIDGGRDSTRAGTSGSAGVSRRRAVRGQLRAGSHSAPALRNPSHAVRPSRTRRLSGGCGSRHPRGDGGRGRDGRGIALSRRDRAGAEACGRGPGEGTSTAVRLPGQTGGSPPAAFEHGSTRTGRMRMARRDSAGRNGKTRATSRTDTR